MTSWKDFDQTFIEKGAYQESEKHFVIIFLLCTIGNIICTVKLPAHGAGYLSFNLKTISSPLMGEDVPAIALWRVKVGVKGPEVSPSPARLA